jgi:hypothetical protein
MKKSLSPLLYFPVLFLFSCGQNQAPAPVNVPGSAKDSNRLTYEHDRDFLKKYLSLVELKLDASRLLVVPAYQGRVMTSSSSGDTGYSAGWVNYDLIASQKLKTHINPFGGEERLWLGPEGGQYSFFFKKGVPYDFDHWFTPAAFDTDSFAVSNQTDTSVEFKKDILLMNRSGAEFSIRIERKINLLGKKPVADHLNILSGSGIQVVAYASENSLTNTGKTAWTKKTGAPAIWLLGMLKPSPQTTIVLPTTGKKGDSSTRLHDQYFGLIPGDRLKRGDDIFFLKADGKFRGKVGIPPQHATRYIGSYDAGNKLLTLLESSWPAGQNEFVNGAWEDQKDPFSGDAFNAYNDGPLKDGSQLGPFYELESLSAAAFLRPGQTLTYTQITYHLQGDEKELDRIAKQTLGMGIQEIKKVF